MIHGSEYLFLWQPSVMHRVLSHPTNAHTHLFNFKALCFALAHTHLSLSHSHCIGYSFVTHTHSVHMHTRVSPASLLHNHIFTHSVQVPFLSQQMARVTILRQYFINIMGIHLLWAFRPPQSTLFWSLTEREIINIVSCVYCLEPEEDCAVWLCSINSIRRLHFAGRFIQHPGF